MLDDELANEIYVGVADRSTPIGKPTLHGRQGSSFADGTQAGFRLPGLNAFDTLMKHEQPSRERIGFELLLTNARQAV